MNIWQATPAEWIGGAQLALGVVTLVIVSVYLQVSGKLRRALDFPAAPANTLAGAHILIVLIVFALVMQMSALGMRLLGHEPAASQPGTTAPTDPVQLLMQLLAELAGIVAALYIARDTFIGQLGGLGLRGHRLGWNLGWAIIAYLAFWPACSIAAETGTIIYEWLTLHKPVEHKVLELLENPALPAGWQVVAWTLAGLVAPVFEELLFRGLLLTWLRRVTRSTIWAIVISGVAFGVVHASQWHLVPALAMLGILAGYLYARTGSLTMVIWLHVLFNVRTLVMLYVAGEG